MKSKPHSIANILEELLMSLTQSAEQTIIETLDVLEGQAREIVNTLDAEITAAAKRKKSAEKPTPKVKVKKWSVNPDMSEPRKPGRAPLYKTCMVQGCSHKHAAKGVCASHYQMMRKTGLPIDQLVPIGKRGGRMEKKVEEVAVAPVKRKTILRKKAVVTEVAGPAGSTTGSQDE